MTDWLKKANEVLGDIAGQAGRGAESMQLQAKLGSLDKDLDRVYIEAGKRAEELLKARQIYDDELRVILERARVIDDEMMEVRQKVQDLRQKAEPAQPEAPAAPAEPVAPPQPTASAPASPTPAQAMPGAVPTPTAPAEEASGEKACAECGGNISTQMGFCPHCGAKQEE